MSAVELGYRPEHLTTAGYELPRGQYATQTAVDAFNHELMTRLRRLTGAVSATFADVIPGSDSGLQTFVVQSYAAPKGAGLNVAVPSQVDSDYFRTMGIALLRGRYFNDGDRSGTQLAVIVNHKFAQHFWPNQDPLGRQMRIGTPEMKTPWMSVIGEVADVKLGAPDTDTMEQFYQPVDQAAADMGSAASPGNLRGDGGYIVLRSTLPAEETENALRAAVRTIDPLLPLAQVQTVEQAVASGEASRKFNTALITSFAIAAILLAVLGIYSIIAFSVAARQQEMAIRMALGSQRGRIVQLVVISGAKLAAVGCVIGVAGAVAASGLLRSMLFGVSPFDPSVIVLAAVAVVLLAVGASALPALRAASIDPIQTLRAE